jgi:hypothetical protein
MGNRFEQYVVPTDEQQDNRFAKYTKRKEPSTVDSLKSGSIEAAYGLTKGISDPFFGAGQFAAHTVNTVNNAATDAFGGRVRYAAGDGIKKPDTWSQAVTDEVDNYINDGEKLYQHAAPDFFPSGPARFLGNMLIGTKMLPNAPRGLPMTAALVNGAKTGAQMALTAPVYNSGEDYWAHKAKQEALAAAAGAGVPYLGRKLGEAYGAIEPMLPWATKKVVGNNILRNTTQDAQLGGVAPDAQSRWDKFVADVKQGLSPSTAPTAAATPVQGPTQLNLSRINGPRSVAEVQGRLKTYLDNPFVPGSKLTTAQVINTDAAARGEKALLNGSNAESFGNQLNQNNQARLDLLARLARTPEDLQKAMEARATATQPLYEKAFASDMPITPELQALLSTPNAQPAIARGMKLLSNRMKGESGITPDETPAILDANGNPFASDTPQGTISGRMLQALKLGLQAQHEEGLQNGMAKLEQDALGQQRTFLHGWLKKNAPDYLDADSKFAELSKPINDMRVAQAIKDGLGVVEDPNQLATTAEELARRKSMTTGGQTKLTLNNFNASMRKALGGPEGEYGVTPETATQLDRIAADLQREGSGARAVEKTGSDTAYNLQAPGMISKWLYGPEMEGGGKALPGAFGSVGSGLGYVFGSMFGPELGGGAAFAGLTGGAKAGSFVGKATAERLNQEFSRAMLDPAYYSQLLHDALVRQQGGLLNSLGDAAAVSPATPGILNSF